MQRHEGDEDLEGTATELARTLAGLDVTQRLQGFRREVAGPLVFTTSFGVEGQVILHHLCDAAIDVDIVTLDTGRLFPETYELWQETEARYGVRIRAIYPRHDAVQALVTDQGINGFYASLDARTACCNIRKVEPLGRALSDARGWIVGLRADQSAHRGRASLVTIDLNRHLLKICPLFDWRRTEVLAFATRHGIPINPLHCKGFVSIGCAPCTRAISPGEPERAGRWWWEDDAKKECGLHAGDMMRSAASAARPAAAVLSPNGTN
jgi:phosphoadenosine phosphosulfate reductase